VEESCAAIENDNGQSTTTGLNGVTVVAAGRECSLAVSNGLVIAWGDDSYGQTNVPSPVRNNALAMPAGLIFGRGSLMLCRSA
jgi:hypothetical protein